MFLTKQIGKKTHKEHFLSFGGLKSFGTYNNSCMFFSHKNFEYIFRVKLHGERERERNILNRNKNTAESLAEKLRAKNSII